MTAMLIKVKLFSVLRDRVDNYDPALGIELKMAAQAQVGDVIRHLKIASEQFPVVSCNGRILKAGDPLTDGSVLHIFQPVGGG
jgi:sulfur carrier protein ThiS